MDIQRQSQQPISDDQELAKVLAGVTQQNNPVQDSAVPADLSAPAQEPAAAEPEIQMPPLPEAPEEAEPTPAAAAETPAPAPEAADRQAAPTSTGNDDLDSIKQEALGDLRPLVDKLDVSPEEKFDTYLLLLRSTDDQALIAPAYASARGIADEARRAQALLDVIKEIDYLSAPR